MKLYINNWCYEKKCEEVLAVTLLGALPPMNGSEPMPIYPDLDTGEHVACPYCGSTSLDVDYDSHHVWIYCESCDSTGPRVECEVGSGSYPLPSEVLQAYKMWDKRVT